MADLLVHGSDEDAVRFKSDGTIDGRGLAKSTFR
jgi:hypothetical protein